MSRPFSTNTVTARTGLAVAKLLWPDFVRVGDCVFLERCNLPPTGSSATDWEAFCNHTHVLDEFRGGSGTLATSVEAAMEDLTAVSVRYNELHPDCIAASALGTLAARLWALKLKSDFPHERFRVYYTQYDNPIVRFHKVRVDEPVWLTDDFVRSATASDFRNAVVYDTGVLEDPVFAPAIQVH